MQDASVPKSVLVICTTVKSPRKKNRLGSAIELIFSQEFAGFHRSTLTDVNRAPRVPDNRGIDPRVLRTCRYLFHARKIKKENVYENNDNNNSAASAMKREGTLIQ